MYSQLGSRMQPCDQKLALPRPLWQIKEEYARLLTQRPPNHKMQELSNWASECEGLRLWIEYGESNYGDWAKSSED